MKRNKFWKLIAFCMMIITTLSISTPAMAASKYINSSGSVIEDIVNSVKTGKDKNQNEETKYESYSSDSSTTTSVYVSQASTFSVIAPVIATMNGEADKNGNYTGTIKYSVTGNIAGNEVVTVEPDSSFELKQPEKENILCNIVSKDGNTAKTKFTYGEGLKIGNTVSQEYTLTTKDVTAGSWVGYFSTNISISDSEKFYSSVKKAVDDANNLTTENADISVSNVNNAAASLFVSNNNAYITLLNDASDVEALTLNNNTVLDLQNNSLSFKTGKNLVFNKDFTILNGNVISTDTNKTIQGSTSNTSGEFYLNDIKLTQNVTSSISFTAIGVDISTLNSTFRNFSIIQQGNGNNSHNTLGIATRNKSTDSNTLIDNFNFDSTITGGDYQTAVQPFGNTVISNFNITINTVNAGTRAFNASQSAVNFTAKSGNIDLKTNREINDNKTIAVNICASVASNIKDVNINLKGNTSEIRGIDISPNSYNNKLENVTINLESNSNNIFGIATFGNDLTMIDSDIQVNSKNAQNGNAICGITGNNKYTNEYLKVINSKISVNSEGNNQPIVSGVELWKYDLDVNGSEITTSSINSNQDYGIRTTNENINIVNTDVTCNTKNVSAGAAVKVDNDSNVTNKKTYITKSDIYGTHNGVITSEKNKTEIKNSNITSATEPITIKENTDVYDSKIKTINRDKYSAKEIGPSFFSVKIIRSDNNDSARNTINFYNCEIGNPMDDVSNYSYYTFLTYNDSCTSCPFDVNIYDSITYRGKTNYIYLGTPISSFVKKGTKKSTTYNLYGSTKIMKDNQTEISKEQIASDIEYFNDQNNWTYPIRGNVSDSTPDDEKYYASLWTPNKIIEAHYYCADGTPKSYAYEDTCGLHDKR